MSERRRERDSDAGRARVRLSLSRYPCRVRAWCVVWLGGKIFFFFDQVPACECVREAP